MARELGGGRKAQVLAALAAATSPQLLAAFHLLSTTAFDLFFWSAITLLVVRLLRTGDERLWLAVGAVAGVGLMNKFNVAFLLVGLAAGLLLGGRGRALRSVWLWAGAALALALWSPNLIWNAQHDWAAFAMLRSLHQENSTLGASLVFIPAQFFVVGPVLDRAVVRWAAAPAASPLRQAARTRLPRPLGAVHGDGGQALLPGRHVLRPLRRRRNLGRRAPRRPASAAGHPRLGGLDDRRRRLALPLALPVLPASALAKGPWEGSINKDLSATVGWQSLVRQIAKVSATLPAAQRAHLVIFTGDYGAAGAVDLYGGRYGLPHAISGHNSYWWWGPGDASNGCHHHRRRLAAVVSANHLLRGHSGGHRGDPRRGVERRTG